MPPVLAYGRALSSTYTRTCNEYRHACTHMYSRSRRRTGAISTTYDVMSACFARLQKRCYDGTMNRGPGSKLPPGVNYYDGERMIHKRDQQHISSCIQRGRRRNFSSTIDHSNNYRQGLPVNTQIKQSPHVREKVLTSRDITYKLRTWEGVSESVSYKRARDRDKEGKGVSGHRNSVISGILDDKSRTSKREIQANKQKRAGKINTQGTNWVINSDGTVARRSIRPPEKDQWKNAVHLIKRALKQTDGAVTSMHCAYVMDLCMRENRIAECWEVFQAAAQHKLSVNERMCILATKSLKYTSQVERMGEIVYAMFGYPPVDSRRSAQALCSPLQPDELLRVLGRCGRVNDALKVWFAYCGAAPVVDPTARARIRVHVPAAGDVSGLEVLEASASLLPITDSVMKTGTNMGDATFASMGNAVLAGMVPDRPLEALKFYEYELLPHRTFAHDLSTVNALLSAYAHLSDYESGVQLFRSLDHAFIPANPTTRSTPIYKSPLYNKHTAVPETIVSIRKVLHPPAHESPTSGLAPTRVTYHKMLRLCCATGNYDAMADVVLGMWHSKPQSDLRPNADTIAVGLDALTRSGEWERALVFFETLSAAPNLEQTTRSYNTLLHAYGSGGVLKKLPTVLQKMKAGGVKRDVVTYNTVMSAFAQAGCYPEAVQVFKAGQRDGTSMDAISYTTVINAANSSGRYKEALRWFDEMRSQKFRLNATAYASALTACVGGGSQARAVDLFSEMRALGVRPSEDGYIAIFNAFTQLNMWKEVVKVIDLFRVSEMCQQTSMDLNTAGKEKADPKECIASSKLVNYGHRRDTGAKPHRLTGYVGFSAEELSPSINVYNAALTALLEMGQWRPALRIFTTLTESHRPSQPRNISSTSHSARSDVDRPFFGTPIPDTGTYNTALLLLSMGGRPHEALRVFKQLKGNERDDITYRNIIQVMSEHGHLDSLKLILRDYQQVQTARDKKDEISVTHGLPTESIDDPMRGQSALILERGKGSANSNEVERKAHKKQPTPAPMPRLSECHVQGSVPPNLDGEASFNLAMAKLRSMLDNDKGVTAGVLTRSPTIPTPSLRVSHRSYSTLRESACILHRPIVLVPPRYSLIDGGFKGKSLCGGGLSMTPNIVHSRPMTRESGLHLSQQHHILQTYNSAIPEFGPARFNIVRDYHTVNFASPAAGVMYTYNSSPDTRENSKIAHNERLLQTGYAVSSRAINLVTPPTSSRFPVLDAPTSQIDESALKRSSTRNTFPSTLAQRIISSDSARYRDSRLKATSQSAGEEQTSPTPVPADVLTKPKSQLPLHQRPINITSVTELDEMLSHALAKYKYGWQEAVRRAVQINDSGKPSAKLQRAVKYLSTAKANAVPIGPLHYEQLLSICMQERHYPTVMSVLTEMQDTAKTSSLEVWRNQQNASPMIYEVGIQLCHRQGCGKDAIHILQEYLSTYRTTEAGLSAKVYNEATRDPGQNAEQVPGLYDRLVASTDFMSEYALRTVVRTKNWNEIEQVLALTKEAMTERPKYTTEDCYLDQTQTAGAANVQSKGTSHSAVSTQKVSGASQDTVTFTHESVCELGLREILAQQTPTSGRLKGQTNVVLPEQRCLMSMLEYMREHGMSPFELERTLSPIGEAPVQDTDQITMRPSVFKSKEQSKRLIMCIRRILPKYRSSATQLAMIHVCVSLGSRLESVEALKMYLESAYSKTAGRGIHESAEVSGLCSQVLRVCAQQGDILNAKAVLRMYDQYLENQAESTTMGANGSASPGKEHDVAITPQQADSAMKSLTKHDLMYQGVTEGMSSYNFLQKRTWRNLSFSATILTALLSESRSTLPDATAQQLIQDVILESSRVGAFGDVMSMCESMHKDILSMRIVCAWLDALIKSKAPPRLTSRSTARADLSSDNEMIHRTNIGSKDILVSQIRDVLEDGFQQQGRMSETSTKNNYWALCFNTILRSCVAIGDRNTAESAFLLQAKFGVKPRSETLNMMLKLGRESPELNTMVACVKRLTHDSRGISDIDVANEHLRRLVRERQLRMCDYLFERILPTIDISPDKSTYDIYLHYLRNHTRWEKIAELYPRFHGMVVETLRRNGGRMADTTYHTDGVCHADGAYLHALHAQVQLGERGEVLDIINDVYRARVMPTAQLLYVAAMNCVQRKGVLAALSLCERMQDAHFELVDPVWERVVAGLTEAGLSDDVSVILRVGSLEVYRLQGTPLKKSKKRYAQIYRNDRIYEDLRIEMGL